MAQVIPITAEQDAILIGVAKKMATDMETGRRPFSKYFQMDSGGSIVFQKVGEKVRALVSSVVGDVVGYGRRSDGVSHPYSALSWRGNKYTVLSDADGLTQNAVALGISKDGKTIVGRDNGKAMKWVNGVSTALLDGLGPDVLTAAIAVSASGGVIAGSADIGEEFPGGTARACRWDDGIFTELINPPDFVVDPYTVIGITTASYGISTDGFTVVGESINYYTYLLGLWSPIRIATMWVNGVPSYLSVPPLVYDAFTVSTIARGTSGDGKIVVGELLDTKINMSKAVLWENGEMAYLATAPSDTSVALAISEDGKVIVGHSGGGPTTLKACKWIDGEQIFLPTPPDRPYSSANGVSSDGKTIVGDCLSDTQDDPRAIKWVGGDFVDLNADLGLSVATGVAG